MKLKTSYFNATAFWKDITRNAPVWGLYTVFLLIYLSLAGDRRSGTAAVANTIGNGMGMFLFFNAVYALLCAALLFGDLFNSRLCNALHAMPLRREGWFLIHTAAGLCFSFVPNLLFAVAAGILMGPYWTVAMWWLLAASLQFLFFFGLAVFSAMVSGNRFAMVVVYGLVNFLSYLVYYLLEILYLPLLPGVVLTTEIFTLLCPIAHMDASFLNLQKMYEAVWNPAVTGSYRVVREDWLYQAAAAAIGLGLLVLALLLYRKRHLESAGDFVALRPAAPVFLVIYTLTAGVLVQLLCELFGAAGQGILFVGVVLGFFTGKMLLQRTVSVFRPKVFLGFGVLAVLLALTMGLTWLDPAGIAAWMPDVQEVASASVEPGRAGNGGFTIKGSFSVEDSERIEEIISLHRMALEENVERSGDSDMVPLTIRYVMKDGSFHQRTYTIPVDSPGGETFGKMLCRPENVVYCSSWEQFAQRAQAVSLNGGFYILREELPGLAEALRLDAESGALNQSGYYVKDWSSGYQLEYSLGQGRYYLYIFDTCVNTIRWLQAHGYDPEFFY